MNKGSRVRVYPTEEQEKLLKQELGNQRFLWNKFLWLNIKYHKKTGKFKFYNDMCKELPKFKEKYSFLKIGNSQSLQQTLKDLDKALKACFRNKAIGFPKFKKKNSTDSCRIPQHFKLNRKKSLLKLPGYKILKVRGILPEKEETIKNITLIRDCDKWYASLCIEFTPKPLKKTGKNIGLDVGSNRLYTSNDGNYIVSFKDLRYVKKAVIKLKTMQRGLSNKFECWKQRTGRKKLNKNEIVSNSYEKCKLKLQKCHKLIRDMRKDYLHQKTTSIVKNYDLIVVEDLNIKKMTKSIKGNKENPGNGVKIKQSLNRNLLDNGLGMFFSLLKYKCEWYGKELKEVPPFFTSQKCHRCENIDPKNRSKVDVSKFKCIKCGLLLNADHNAAINILYLGIAALN